MTGSEPVAPDRATIRTRTAPTSAGTVIQSSSTASLSIAPPGCRRRPRALVGGQLVQERRRGGRLDERLRGGFEHDDGPRALVMAMRINSFAFRSGYNTEDQTGTPFRDR